MSKEHKHVHEIAKRVFYVADKQTGEPLYVAVYCKKCRVSFGFNVFDQAKFLKEIK